MSLLSWILFGLLAGLVAKVIYTGKEPGGFLVTIIIGIIGAMLGGFIGVYGLHIGDVTGWNFRSFGLAVLGSVIVLWIYGLLRNRQ